MPAAEWKFWMDDGEMSRAAAGRMADLFKNNRRVFDALGRKVTQYEPNKEVAPGITAVPTVGHTPGHSSFVIASGSSRVYVQSDVTNHPALFARNPRWHLMFDQDPAKAEETRLKVYDMVVAEKMLMQGFHYPFPRPVTSKKTAGLSGDADLLESGPLGLRRQGEEAAPRAAFSLFSAGRGRR